MEHSYRDSTFRAIVEGCLVVLPGNFDGCSMGRKVLCVCAQPRNKEEPGTDTMVVVRKILHHGYKMCYGVLPPSTIHYTLCAARWQSPCNSFCLI